MATTTNYSWTTPNDTDLVKDGAAAIRTLGSSADTTVKNLNPGTTAGDIDYYTSGTAKARIAIGTAGQVLQVNSGATAPEWATPAGGGSMTLISTTNLAGASVTLSAIPGTYRDLRLVIKDFYHANGAGIATDLRFNVNGTNSIYGSFLSSSTGTANPLTNANGDVSEAVAGVANDNIAILEIFEYTSTTTNKYALAQSVVRELSSNFRTGSIRTAIRTTSAITSITLLFSSGSFTSAGTVELYGVN